MDKAYTLMYGLDKKGKIAGNAFTHYDSIENIKASLNLTLPKYSIKDSIEEHSTSIINIIQTLAIKYKDIIADNIINWDAIKNYIDNSDYYFIDDFIKELNKYQTIAWEYTVISDNDSLNNKIIDKNISNNYIKNLFINYTHEGVESLKNRIVNAIWTQSTDLKNLESAEQPMSMKKVVDIINQVRKDKGLPNEEYYSEYNPYTLYKIQRANSIGKDDVGISANGVKGAGALQQHMNMIYKNWNSLTEEEQNRSKIRENLTFNTSSGNHIASFKFFKLANTHMSKELFKSELLDACGGTLETHPDYALFEQLVKNENVNITSSHDLKLKSIFENYKQKVPLVTNQNFIDFLFYTQSFEENVADTISIFISMATDNAKELALAKIYATPELLSLPLAMLTLGMDIESTVKVCIEILSEVHNRLTTNRFNPSRGHLTVRQIIQNLNKPSTSGLSFDQQTCDSLLHIYDFAQELKTITGFFKVNQGVTTKYSELKSWLNNLTLSRKLLYENKFGKSYKQVGLEEALSTPLNYSKLNTDEDYKKKILSQYDVSREVVNVIDVVLQSPHFNSQLQATATVLSELENMATKSTIVDKLIGIQNIDFHELDSKTTESDKNEDTNTTPQSANNLLELSKIPLTALQKKKDVKQLMDKLIKLVDHWIIRDYLFTNPEFTLSMADIQYKFPQSKFMQYSSTSSINLASNYEVNKFLDFMNYDFIPNLITQFPNNLFIDGLESGSDRQTGKKYFDFKYDPYKLKDNPSLIENFNIAKKDFNVIKDIGSGIHNPTTNREFTIGELLYLYSIIVSRGSIKGMGYIVNTVGSESVILAGGLDQKYRNLDRLIQYPTETNQSILNSILNFLKPYARALANPLQKNTFKLSNGTEETLDLNKEFLYTFNEPKLASSTTYSLPINKNKIDFTKINNILNQKFDLCEIEIIPTKALETVTDDVDNLYQQEVKIKIKIKSISGKEMTEVITTSEKNTKLYVNLQKGAGDSYLLFNDDVDDLYNIIFNYVSGTKQFILNQDVLTALSNTDISEENLLNIHKNEVITLFGSNDTDFYEFLFNPHNVLLTHQGPSFVRNIAGKKLIIINSNDPALIEPKTALYRAMELFLQYISPVQLTENQMLEYLLNYLVKPKNFSITSIQNIQIQDKIGLQKFIETAQLNNELKEFFINFSTFLFNTSTTEKLKTQGQLMLAEYESYIDNLDLYYVNNQKNTSELKVGDICEFGPGNKKLLIFQDDFSHIFVSIGKNAGKVTYEDINKCTKVWTKVLDKNIQFTKFSPNDFSYSEIETPSLLDNLKIGDKFKITGRGEFFIQNILYYSLNGDTKKQLILTAVDDKAKEFIKKFLYSDSTSFAIQHSITHTVQNWITFNETLFYGINNKVSANIGISNHINLDTNEKKWLPFDKSQQNVVDFLLKYMQYNSFIKTKSNEIYQIIGYTNEAFILNDGTTINFDDVIAVQFYQNNLNLEEFFNNYKPKVYYDINSETHIIKWRPELAHGFLATTPTEKRDDHKIKMSKFVAVHTQIKNGKVVYFPNIALSSDYINTQEAEINNGDIFINYVHNNNIATTQIYKIIDKTKKLAAYSTYYFTDIKEDKFQDKIDYHLGTTAIVSYDDEYLLKSNEHYTDYKNYHTNSYLELYTNASYNNENINEAGMEFLQYIQNTLKMKVETIQSKDDFFAKVQNNTLIINLSKKPKDQNLSTYILSQAAHEYTHLLLANLKTNTPSIYTILLEELRTQINQINSPLYKIYNTQVNTKTGNEIYTSEAAKLEECLVRLIEDSVTLQSDLSLVNIKNIINKEFKNLFKLSTVNDVESEFTDLTIKAIFSKYKSDFVATAEKEFNMSAIRSQKLKDDVFSNTTMKCK